MSVDGLGDSEVAAILLSAQTFAVVGASANAVRPVYGVMEFLIARGYAVHPINPGLAGQSLLGRSVYASLAGAPAPIDVVDIFRNSDAAAAVVDEAIAEATRLGIKTIWMQIGVANEAAAARARQAGLTVVMDRCPKIELARLRLG
ncbi:MAG: CoA-binding protein [Hyphomicrobium sp.]